MAARPLLLAVTAAVLAMAMVSCGADDEGGEVQAVEEAQAAQATQEPQDGDVAQEGDDSQELQVDAEAQAAQQDAEAQAAQQDDVAPAAQEDGEAEVAQEAQPTAAPATTAAVPEGTVADTGSAGSSVTASEQQGDSDHTATLEVLGPTSVRLGETVTLSYSTTGSEFREMGFEGINSSGIDLSLPSGEFTVDVTSPAQTTFSYILASRGQDGTILQPQVTLTVTDPLPHLSGISISISPLESDLPGLMFDGDRLNPPFDPDILRYNILISYDGVLPSPGLSKILTVTATAADGYEVSAHGTREYGPRARWTPSLSNDALNALTPGSEVRTAVPTSGDESDSTAVRRIVRGGTEGSIVLFGVRSLEDPRFKRTYRVLLDVRRR